MELNWSKLLIKISNLVTISSYLKGTIIFTIFTISNQGNGDILYIGLYFIGFAFLVNLFVLIITLVVIRFTKDSELKIKLWISIGFQLLNIPIAITYLYFVLNNSSNMY